MKKRTPPLINRQGEVAALTDAHAITATKLSASFPDLAAYAVQRKVGRPKKPDAKRLQSFKLSPEVIEAVKASGKGFNARVEAVLREAIKDGRI